MIFQGVEIQVTKRKNCKHFILRRPATGGMLQLSTPYRATKGQIETFLTEHQAWLHDHAGQVQTWQPAYAAGEVHWHLGQQVVLGSGGVPCGQQAFVSWQVSEFINLTKSLTLIWAKRLQVSPTGLKYRDLKSKWGSCNTKTRVILYNTKLAAMPPDCIEYVVVHELCHLIHPNHSPLFHQEMQRHLPDWAERKKRLNRFLLEAKPHPPHQL